MRKIYEALNTISESWSRELISKTKELEMLTRIMESIFFECEENVRLERTVLMNLNDSIMPRLAGLKKDLRDKSQIAQVDDIELQIKKILSPIQRKKSGWRDKDLTPRENEILLMIKGGKTTKEIASALHLSAHAIDFHRNNIRSKLGIKNMKKNLRAHLMSISDW